MMRTHGKSYRNHVNAIFADANLKNLYVGGYLACTREDRYSLPIDEMSGVEELVECPSPRRRGGDMIDVVDHPSNPS